MKRNLFIVTLAGIAIFATGCGIHQGSGEKIGTIVKVSDDGVFHATWEAEVIKGGMGNGSGSFSTKPEWVTLTTPQDVAFAQKAMNEQREVVIDYTEMMAAPWSSDTENKFVTAIRYSEKP